MRGLVVVLIAAVGSSPMRGATRVHADGRGCELLGRWEQGRRTCTLERDHHGPIELAGDGITLDGAGFVVRGDGDHVGVRVQGHRRARLTRLEVREFRVGIRLDGGSHHSVSESVISSNARGLVVAGSDQVEVVRTRVVLAKDGILVAGTAADPVRGLVLRENTVRRVRDRGVVLMHHVGTRVEDNELQQARGAALDLGLGTRQAIVRDNLVVGSGAYAVRLVQTEGVALRDNHLEGGRGVGVFLEGGRGAVLEDNRVCGFPVDVRATGKGQGRDNACDHAEGWDDAGARGCSRPCRATGWLR